MKNDTLLNAPATAHRLRWLAQNDVLKPHALARALRLIGHTPDKAQWLRFLDILLLVLGVGSLVSGVFFFFAFNWAGMHRFVKLGVLETAVLLTALLAYQQGLNRLPGKIALTAASLLVGALFAVYGQIYQTGADAYQLFLTWALLISGWVVICRFTPLWFIWLLLVDATLIFYWEQVIGGTDTPLYLILILLQGAAIVIWEMVHAEGVAWLQSRWVPRLWAIAVFYGLTALTMDWIWASSLFGDGWLGIMPLLLTAVSLLTFYIYSQKILDLFMLTLAAFSLIVASNTWIVDILDFEEVTFCLLSFLLIGEVALVVHLLRHVSTAWEVQNT